MGLFSKPKIPGIDTASLSNIAVGTANKKRNIINSLGGDLQPISNNFRAERDTLGRNFTMGVDKQVEQFKGELSQLGTADAAAREKSNAAFREQAFRDVPEIQRSIRQSLGGAGTLNTGTARRAIANPIIDAANSSRDFTAQNEVSRLLNDEKRNEMGVTTGYNARSKALEDKFGLDKDTIDFLTETGRTDLIDRAKSLIGVEDQLGDDQLAIEQIRQNNDIARATAAASRRANVTSGLLQVGGAAAGSFFGPMGTAIGSQVGANAGQLVNGQPTTIDPTLLFALSQRRNNVVKNLSGGRSTIPGYSPY